MKKNSRVRRWLAMILCVTLVLSSNVVSMAAEENGAEVQAVTEEPVVEGTEPEASDEPVPADITEPETLTTTAEDQTGEPAETEGLTEEGTEPETQEVPQTDVPPVTEEPMQTPAEPETEEHVKPETPATFAAPQTPEGPEADETELEDSQDAELFWGEKKEYPVYVSPQNGGNYLSHEAVEKKDNPAWYDFRYDEEEGHWYCHWTDDPQHVEPSGYGPRNQHYVRIKYLNDVGGDIYAICFVRCDMYGGEEQEKIYYPVFFIDEEGNTLLKEANGRFWESVEKENNPKKTPELENGYWTLGKYDGGLIEKEEQLKNVTDPNPNDHVDPTTTEITTQTVFIWHENPVQTYFLEFTKVAEDNQQPLQGAEFELLQNEGFKRKATSDQNGKVIFENLEAGTYTLKETKAPENYELPNTEWEVQVGDGGVVSIRGEDAVQNPETKQYQILNKREGGELNFAKVDTKGSPLAGAEFALYDKEDTEYEKPLYTGSSDVSGNVKITGIPEGTYAMKETKAPEGYLVSGLVWTVEATKDRDSIKVVLKDGTDTEISSITNRKNNEYLPVDVEQNKTATLIDWDDRTYQLDLTANSLMETTVEGSVTPIDVVLVLDVSGSMNFTMGYTGLTGATSWNDLKKNRTYYFVKDGVLYEVQYNDWFSRWEYCENGDRDSERLSNLSGYRSLTYYTSYKEEGSRLGGLIEVAKSFVGTLKEQSPDSRVGIVTFQSSGKSESVLGLTDVENSNIVSKIEGLTAGGGTYPSEAITKAGNMFGRENPRDKHVIFLTDGDCGQNSNSIDQDEIDDCVREANKLKEKNIEIHAIRFATTKANYLEKIVTDVITNDEGKPIGKKVYTANNIDELIESFNLILQGSVSKLPIAGATIVDTIDKHFVVTDRRGNPLKNGAAIYPDTTPIVGRLEIDSAGNQRVVWTNQSIQVVGDNGEPGWKATIYIKAKEDYIGGNGVTTNGSDSGIYIGDSTTPLTTFPIPEVNVKADLTVADTETTIFLGESIPTDNVQGTMFEMSGWLNKYDDVTEDDFSFVWYKDEVCSQPISLDEMKAEKPEKQTEYYLKVTYHTGDPADESHSDMRGHVNGSQDNRYTIADTGVYTVKIVSGTIKIHKILDGTNNIQLEGAPTFTFKIEYTSPEGESQVSYKTVKFNDEKTKDLWTEELTDLPKGDYKITELETLKFSNEKTAAGDETTCQSDIKDNQITFHIGTPEKGEEDRGQVGVAEFTNKKTTDSGKRTDTDVRVNRFTKDKYDNWTWKGYDVPQEANSKQ